MKIYFAHSDEVPSRYSNIPSLSHQLGEQRDAARHYEVSEPSDADVVLFSECHLLQDDWCLQSLVGSKLGRAFAGKLAVYDERDLPWCRLPGIYVSMPRSGFVPRWQVAGSYWHVQPLGQRTHDGGDDVRPDLLFSFVGSRTHPCRRDVLALSSARAHIEAVDDFMFWDATSPQFEEKRLNFADVTSRSKFVLCPRGHGTSSIRLFEVMSAGRAPVIIADDWVPPIGPDWCRFSLRWPSYAIAEIPRVLERLEEKASAMGALARAAYQDWFAPDIVMTRQLDQLEQLLCSSPGGRFPAHGYRNVDYFRGWGRRTVGALRRRVSK